LDVFGLPTVELDVSPRDVGFVNKYMISTSEQNFEIVFSANFLISSHAFSASDKTIQFEIETSLEEENIGEIIIPRDLIDGEFVILLDGKEISASVHKSSKSSIVSIEFDGKGKHTLEITLQKSNGGGCLIATAAFGSEIAPQVQQLRELRDNTVLQTESGTSFMTGFNQFYYSFSPAVADYERENPAFKEAVKITLTPLLTSLTLLQYTDIDSESEMLGYGIGIILLNIGMYFVAPAVLIMIIRKRV
tara:strand:+ start:545 stop:1288 length:744 start_codon:yes stop_codon:yes gene_type:complete